MTKTILMAVLAAAAAPLAAEPPAPVSATVRIADLDLGSSQGQRALQHRLRIAVAEVCGTASPADLKGQNAVRKCRSATFASAAQSAATRIAAKDRSAVAIAAR